MSGLVATPGMRVCWRGPVHGEGDALLIGTVVRRALPPLGPNAWIVAVDGSEDRAVLPADRLAPAPPRSATPEYVEGDVSDSGSVRASLVRISDMAHTDLAIPSGIDEDRLPTTIARLMGWVGDLGVHKLGRDLYLVTSRGERWIVRLMPAQGGMA